MAKSKQKLLSNKLYYKEIEQKLVPVHKKKQNIAEKILKNIFLEKKLLKIFKCAVCVQNQKKWDNLFTKIIWYL